MTDPRAAPPRLSLSARVVIVVLLGALVGVVVLGFTAPSAPEATQSAPAPGATPEPTSVPASPAPSTTPGPAPGPRSPVTAPSLQPIDAVRRSTEVGGAPVDRAADAAAATPAPPTLSALIAGSAPPSASGIGTLVAGFPAAVPIATDSTIVSSSIDSSGNTVQATVVAHTTRPADEVIASYQTAFAALGLAGSPMQSAAGDRALAFSRGDASITLTVGGDGSGSDYSLFAVITLTP